MDKTFQVCCVCIFVGFTAVTADWLQPQFDEKIMKCIIDNIGHALISAWIWHGSFTYPLGHVVLLTDCRSIYDVVIRRKLYELAAAFSIGSLMDTDHFIAGWTTSLHEATILPTRPFGHSVIFIVVVGVINFKSALKLSFFFQIFALLISRNYRIGLLVSVSLFSHQLRDATRRGLWFWPMGSTPRIPYPIYLVTLCALAPLVHYMCRDNPRLREYSGRPQPISLESYYEVV